MISEYEFKNRMKLYLTPPGDGVFTVHTAKDKKDALKKKLFGNESVENQTYKAIWENNINEELAKASLILLGIPSDTGGGIQRGANWGPLYLREALLQSYEEIKIFDIGDVFVNPHLLDDKYLNQETIDLCRLAQYGDEKIHLPVSPLSIAYDFANHFHEIYKSKKIFAIGGDHSVSYPLVRAYLESKKRLNKKVALIHFDAHTDLLKSRLGIDRCFGTWTSQIMPFLDSPKHLIQLGIRSSGKDRQHWEQTFKHTQIWSDEIKHNPEKVASKVVAELKSLGIEEVYISFDIDCLDESYAGATGTPESKGLSPHEPMVIMQSLYENFKITGADIVEIAPLVKHPHLKQMEPETTLMVASQLSTFLIQAMQ